MTLIEVLCAYCDAVKNHGKLMAERILTCVDPVLKSHIRDSVSDSGEFINAYGKPIKAEDYEEAQS